MKKNIDTATTFAKRLLAWYDQNRRILPWREDPTPYHVFVSEIMLQQTRVDTVLPYYDHFLNKYPTFAALSESSEEEILLYWQGLGYYSRARNLRKAAQMVMRDYGGRLPSSPKELCALPGVGPYVSHAVSAIAFDEPYVAIDGNLMRVYARLQEASVEPSDAKGKAAAERFFLGRIEHPSHFNQALMDLGELVCLPNGEPHCPECPLREQCRAFAHGSMLSYPLPKKKATLKYETRTVLLVRDEQGRLAIQKRPEEGLLAGLYEFPNLEGSFTSEELAERFPSLTDICFRDEAKHRFSHIEWKMRVYAANGSLPYCLRAREEELTERYSMPTAFLKLLG